MFLTSNIEFGDLLQIEYDKAGPLQLFNNLQQLSTSQPLLHMVLHQPIHWALNNSTQFQLIIVAHLF